MKSIKLFLVVLLLSYSASLAQQPPLKWEIHSRGMIRQSVFNNGSLGRPLDNGSGGSSLTMPSFEWPTNGGHPFYVGKTPFNGFYNSMGAGFWLAGDTARYSGVGLTPRINVACGGWLDAEGQAIRGTVDRTENYPVLADGTVNRFYNPNEAEEKIVATWNTPLGVSITRTSRAWSHPDYDDFIIYEVEMTNTGIGAVTGRTGPLTDTIRAMTYGLAYHFAPSMIGGMLKNNGVWNDVSFRGDKDGSLRFNYARYNWTRMMVYNHSINGLPFQGEGDPDTILTAPGAIGVLPLYYDYDHLAIKGQYRIALNSSSAATDTVTLFDNNRKLKQPYALHFDNGNLNLDKFTRAHNPEATRNATPMRSNSDSTTYGQFWIGRAKAGWTNTLRNPTGKTYVFGPYTLPPGASMKFVYAEVAGFGPGMPTDSVYWDMGGGWGSAWQVPVEESSPGIHPVPNWWKAMTYPQLSPVETGYTSIGSNFMQTHPLPSYVTGNVISLRDVADRAIQMWRGGPVVKYDDTSRYMNTFATRDMSKQFDPAPTPIGKSSSTGVFGADGLIPIGIPAPAIFVDNTAAASNKVIWGTQVDSITRATPGFSELTSPLSHYLVEKANNIVGPWVVLDSVQKHDPRFFVSAASIKNKGLLNFTTDSVYAYVDGTSDINKDYFYSVVSIDSLGLRSGRTNIVFHNTQAPAVKKLGHVYAAPNPFIVISGDNSSSAGGLASDKIGFYGLPKRATIRIFSYSGQLVKTLDHESVDPLKSPDGKFANTWFQTSLNDQWVSSGVYFFVVEDKDTGDRAWNKFVIIH